MKTNHTKRTLCTLLTLAAFTISAWKSSASILPVKPFTISQQKDTTVPRKKDKKEYHVGNLDQAIKELDKVILEMNQEMKIDFSKMDKEMKAAMEEVKKIDYEKIGREVEAELKKVNWDKTRAEVAKAMRDAEISIKSVDMKQVEKELAKAKESLSKEKILAHIDMDKIKKNVEESMSKAKIGIEKAKKEIALMKEFTEALEKDGLINRKKGYKLEIKDGELFINGTQQPKEVTDKYRKYFKDENYTISSDGDSISGV